MNALREPLLEARGVVHAFAVRAGEEPKGLGRAAQVHGTRVVRAEECLRADSPPQADAVLSLTPGLGAAVVTADCVPVLLGVPDGSAVAAIHAGWRGLAAGVIQAGVEALARATGTPPEGQSAGIGPHAGACCYEVDEPVLKAFAERHSDTLRQAAKTSRPGHAMLDLATLADAALRAAGLEADAIGRAAFACTCCDPRRFPSYRREGPDAGRLVHFAVPR